MNAKVETLSDLALDLVNSDANNNLMFRRRRSPNFTDKDRKLLIQLIKPQIELIEDKGADRKTCSLKRNIWLSITANFNKLNGQCRSPTQLKLCYENFKYKLKRLNEMKKNVKNEQNSKDVKPVIIDSNDHCIDLTNDYNKFAVNSETAFVYNRIRSTKTASTQTAENLAKMLAVGETDYMKNFVNHLQHIKKEEHKIKMQLFQEEIMFKRREHLKYLQMLNNNN